MLKANILQKGDEVLSINEHFLAIKRKNGEVDIYRIMYNDNSEIYIDPIKMAMVGYGSGTVEKDLDDGKTTVFSF